MKKSEMNEDQRNSRAYFIQKLISAGWDPGGWETLFEDDFPLEPEAQAERQTVDVFQRLSFFISKGYILLDLIGKGKELETRLRFYCQNKMPNVIDQLVAAQDVLASDKYSEAIEPILNLCARAVLETPNGLVEITT